MADPRGGDEQRQAPARGGIGDPSTRRRRAESDVTDAASTGVVCAHRDDGWPIVGLQLQPRTSMLTRAPACLLARAGATDQWSGAAFFSEAGVRLSAPRSMPAWMASWWGRDDRGRRLRCRRRGRGWRGDRPRWPGRADTAVPWRGGRSSVRHGGCPATAPICSPRPTASISSRCRDGARRPPGTGARCSPRSDRTDSSPSASPSWRRPAVGWSWSTRRG